MLLHDEALRRNDGLFKRCGQDTQSEITIDDLQDIARRGKLRMRAFGQVTFFGTENCYGGSLSRAAEDLPRILNCGLVAVYRDCDGIFIGPKNIALVGDADAASQFVGGSA